MDIISNFFTALCMCVCVRMCVVRTCVCVHQCDEWVKIESNTYQCISIPEDLVFIIKSVVKAGLVISW